MWIPKHEQAARRKASKVARFYCAYMSMLHHPPTLFAIGRKFGKSSTWAWQYVRLARVYGYIEEEQDGETN
jgi:hypothetical protein